MKYLLFIRHAKSDWSHDLPDFDRSLNERGHKDAPTMAKHLLAQDIPIDEFVSSPAKRAITTARYFAESYRNPKVRKVEHLYEPHFEDFENTILSLDDKFTSVALFSHNPTISEFVSSLIQENIEFPTCGVAIIALNCTEWSLFETAEKRLVHFFKPKEIE